jgi:ribosomal protein S18 acetylase RimI-like enzyme
MKPITIRPVLPEEKTALIQSITEEWGGTTMVSRGNVLYADKIPTLVAVADDGQVVGHLTYAEDEKEIELVTIKAEQERQGIGTKLIEELVSRARKMGKKRIVLITTNDNTDALRFYQRRGFVLKELRPDAITEARKIKPEIPEFGFHGIPIRDEIELWCEL